MSNSDFQSGEEVSRMVVVIDTDTCDQEYLRNLLTEHDFRFLSSDDEIDRFIDNKTQVVFYAEVKADRIILDAVNKIPSNPHMSSVRRVLNHLNYQMLLGVYTNFEEQGARYLNSRYEFAVYRDPLGYDAGWLSHSIRRFCESHKSVLTTFLGMLASPGLV